MTMSALRKGIFFLLLCGGLLSSFSNAEAQKLTKTEAKAMAQALYKQEVLSLKGKRILEQKIDSGLLERSKAPSLFDGSIAMTRELSKAQIAQFLSGVLQFERLDRMYVDDSPEGDFQAGFSVRTQLIGFLKDVIRYSRMFRGMALESQIEHTCPLPPGTGWSVYPPFLDRNYQIKGAIHHKLSVLGKSCYKILDRLTEAQLIDDDLRQEVKTYLQTNSGYYEPEILQLLAHRLGQKEDFKERKAEEQQFITALFDAGIINTKALTQLRSDTPNQEFRTKYDMATYATKGRVFKLEDYPKNAQEGYEAMFRDAAAIIPDMTLTDLDFKLVKEVLGEIELIQYRAKVKMKLNGQAYAYSFIYDTYSSYEDVPPIEALPTKVAYEFHKVFNKFLIDQNSPFRIYLANKEEPGNAYGSKEFTLLLMTAEQYAAWGKQSYFLSSESHDNRFSSEYISQLLKQFGDIGLFKALSTEALNKGKKEVHEKEISRVSDILICFDELLTVILFDFPETNQPYKYLLEQLSEKSQGHFKPENIQDNFTEVSDKGTGDVWVSFALNGLTFEAGFPLVEFWVDPRIIELVNEGLKHSGIGGTFLMLESSYATSDYLYLTFQQEAYLRKHIPELFIAPGTED